MTGRPTRHSKPAARVAVLIIAGGRGTRFWPLSRNHRPKPLFSLDGKTSLLGETVARARTVAKPDRIFVLVVKGQERAFGEALRGLVPARNLIVEPQGRGTAVAIAYGAAVIERRLGEVTLAVMPADHLIAPTSGFRRTLTDAIEMASDRGAIVVIGIEPTRAEPGFGYQKIGRKVGAGFEVERFVEKPSLRVAQRMVRSRKFLWNAGLFVIGTPVLNAELAAHCPSLAAAIRKIAGAPRYRARAYRRFAFDSFDREVVEKSRRVLGLRARFRWHDVGSWDGLWEAMRSRDRRDNVLTGNVVALGADGVIAHADRRLMVLMGVDDLVAVDAGDALLIAKRSQSQDLRRVTDELKRRGLSRYL